MSVWLWVSVSGFGSCTLWKRGSWSILLWFEDMFWDLNFNEWKLECLDFVQSCLKTHFVEVEFWFLFSDNLYCSFLAGGKAIFVCLWITNLWVCVFSVVRPHGGRLLTCAAPSCETCRQPFCDALSTSGNLKPSTFLPIAFSPSESTPSTILHHSKANTINLLPILEEYHYTHLGPLCRCWSDHPPIEGAPFLTSLPAPAMQVILLIIRLILKEPLGACSVCLLKQNVTLKPAAVTSYQHKPEQISLFFFFCILINSCLTL